MDQRGQCPSVFKKKEGTVWHVFPNKIQMDVVQVLTGTAIHSLEHLSQHPLQQTKQQLQHIFLQHHNMHKVKRCMKQRFV